MREKILIVDDEIMLTELLYTHFSEQGYFGLTLCKNIREIISCPILFLTAKITEQDKINGLRAGGDDYITKPFSLQELSVRVETHLRREARYRQTSQIISSNGLIVDSVSKTVLFKKYIFVLFGAMAIMVIPYVALTKTVIYQLPIPLPFLMRLE